MNTKKDGYALALSMLFIGLISVGTTVLYKMSMQKSDFEERSADRIMARIVAEAGIHQAYALVKLDSNQLSQEFADVSVGDEIASITVSEVNDAEVGLSSASADNSKYYLMKSTATCNDSTVSAAVIIKSSTSTSDEPVDPEVLELFDGAVFCGGDANMVGASEVDLGGGTAHVNGTITMRGSSKFLNGSLVSCSSTITLKGSPTIDSSVAVPSTPSIPWGDFSTFIFGTLSVQDVPEQMIELDLETFRLYAVENDIEGQSYPSGTWNYTYTDSYISEDELPKKGTLQIASCQVVNPAGGVLWVEGDVHIAGSSVINGCVIATGDIKVVGGMTHKQATGFPSFMSVNGDVDIGSSCDVYGLVYAHNGDISISGAANVFGAFICPRGNFTQGGSGNVICSKSRPSGPNGQNVMLPEAEVGEVGGIPEVVRWIL